MDDRYLALSGSAPRLISPTRVHEHGVASGVGVNHQYARYGLGQPIGQVGPAGAGRDHSEASLPGRGPISRDELNRHISPATSGYAIRPGFCRYRLSVGCNDSSIGRLEGELEGCRGPLRWIVRARMKAGSWAPTKGPTGLDIAALGL